MRTCILSSFFFLSCAALAQGIVVTGEFKQEYRSLHLYNNIQKALFILEKGNVYLPENRAYFLKLSPSDAERMETPYILLLPLMDNKIVYEYDTPISFEILPIPNAPNLYYTKKAFYTDKQGKKITLSYPEELPLSPMEKIKKGKPVYHREIKNSDDFRDIPQWIEALSSTQKVTIIAEMCWDGVDNQGNPAGGIKKFKEQELMSTLAKEKLSSLSYFLEGIIPLPYEPTQEDWRQWWQQFQNLPYPILPSSLMPVKTFRKNMDGDRLYALDKETHKVYSIHKNPRYGQEPLLIFDPQNDKVTDGQIYSKEQPDATDFEAIYAQGDMLYTLNSRFVWAKYAPKKENGSLFYQQMASCDVVPEPNKSYRKASYEEIKYEMVQTYTTPECMYMLIQKRETNEY